jgi:hypothetical protein
MNNELEKMWKEMVMATFKICLDELRKSMKNPSKIYSLPVTVVCFMQAVSERARVRVVDEWICVCAVVCICLDVLAMFLSALCSLLCTSICNY